MTDDGLKVGDLLGVKPVAEAIQTTTKAIVDGASAVLSRICLPAAEELGLLFQDKVSFWRAKNLQKITQRLDQTMMKYQIPEGAHAHPRIVHSIVEQGSWSDDTEVQDMWAGLLSSSCTKDGDDDSNLLFVNLLGGLTRLQAKILKYACETVEKWPAPNGLVQPVSFVIHIDALKEKTGEKDIHRLDRELDSLRGMALIQGGITSHTIVSLAPTPLALHMYVRCQGSRLSPLEFFKVTPLGESSVQPEEAHAQPKSTATLTP